MHYVLRLDNPTDPADTGRPTRASLVGPFAHAYAAIDFFSTVGSDFGVNVANPNNPHDNPCWWVVDLKEPQVTFFVSYTNVPEPLYVFLIGGDSVKAIGTFDEPGLAKYTAGMDWEWHAAHLAEPKVTVVAPANWVPTGG